jgi:hypothetical protein
MKLDRAIIYTTKMSKQVTKGHVRDAVHMYPVNGGAGLTYCPLYLASPACAFSSTASSSVYGHASGHHQRRFNGAER